MALDASLTQEQRDVALAEAMSQSAVEYTTNHNVPKMFDGLMQLVLLNQPSDPVEFLIRSLPNHAFPTDDASASSNVKCTTLELGAASPRSASSDALGSESPRESHLDKVHRAIHAALVQGADTHDLWTLFDADGSGSISADEFTSALSKCGIDALQYQLDELLEVFDLNKDGKIQFNEFLHFVSTPVVLKVGSRVEARYDGSLVYCSGRIVAINASGTFSVKYEDGEVEEVRREWCRAV